MKGGNIDRVTAKHICLTSITLIITTILHMARQNLPFDATAFLSRSMPFFSSELHDIPNSSVSIEPTRNSENENSHINAAEGTNVNGKAFGGNNASSSIAQACDYSKGIWVADSRRPLYFPFECEHLSNSWSCRRTHRKDFSYERHRWQPKNCEIQEFNHSAFLRRMQNKTIAFVGDSLGRQQFQSLLCMVTAGKNSPEVEDVSTKYDLFNPYGPIRGAVHGAGWAYRFPSTNTTVLCYWSVSLCDLEPLNTTANNASVAIHLDRPVPFMKKFLHQFDILVLNTGHHWNENKFNANHWVMYVNGKPNEDTNLKDYWNARNFTVYNTVRWLNSQLRLYPRLKAFFRTISPKHFKNGDWNTGGRCDNTVPLTRGSEVLQEESSDATVAGAVEGTGVKILDITALSDLRDEAHISSYYRSRRTKGANDCLHWCLPGIPDTWNEILFAQV